MKRVRRNCSDAEAELQGYNEYKEYLLARGYAEDLIDSAIEQAEGVPRDILLGITGKESSNRGERKYPLIMKFNPKLPPMSKFINNHLHILELTPETAKMFNKDTVFVSYKMEQNILSMITKNKFKASSGPGPMRSEGEDDGGGEWGCFGCNKGCTVCKNFLVVGKTFTSPNTTQTFRIKSRIDCNSKGVIYLINDKKCKDIFYLGYTDDTIKVRWANHKSHIKNCHKTCEIASHFIATANGVHKLDKSNQAVYTSQLSEHLSVQLIEHVEPRQGQDMTSLLLERESFWMGELKSTTVYGGINKRSNRK